MSVLFRNSGLECTGWELGCVLRVDHRDCEVTPERNPKKLCDEALK
jgi:hypothetical protein